MQWIDTIKMRYKTGRTFRRILKSGRWTTKMYYNGDRKFLLVGEKIGITRIINATI